MRINTSLRAFELRIINQIDRLGKAIEQNNLRLSTLKRINSAADDPAGLVFVSSQRAELNHSALHTAAFRRAGRGTRLGLIRHVPALARAATMTIADDIEDLVRGAEAVDAIGNEGSLLQHGLDLWLDASMLEQDALQVAIGGKSSRQAAEEEQCRGAAPAEGDGPARSISATSDHFAF